MSFDGFGYTSWVPISTGGPRQGRNQDLHNFVRSGSSALSSSSSSSHDQVEQTFYTESGEELPSPKHVEAGFDRSIKLKHTTIEGVDLYYYECPWGLITGHDIQVEVVKVNDPKFKSLEGWVSRKSHGQSAQQAKEECLNQLHAQISCIKPSLNHDELATLLAKGEIALSEEGARGLSPEDIREAFEDDTSSTSSTDNTDSPPKSNTKPAAKEHEPQALLELERGDEPSGKEHETHPHLRAFWQELFDKNLPQQTT